MRAITINETINFQRNIDPKQAMGTGNIEAQARLFFQPYIEVLKELKQKDFKHIKYIKFHKEGVDDNWQKEKFKEFDEFYIEFQYNGRYIAIGIDNLNDVIIPSKPISKETFRKLIVSKLLDY